jgi:hypothetical protein
MTGLPAAGSGTSTATGTSNSTSTGIATDTATRVSSATARPARHIAVRLVLATAAVLVAANYLSRDLVQWLLPALAPVLGVVADDFRIVAVEFANDRGNTVVSATAVLTHTVFLGGRAIVPDGQSAMVVGTTIGTVLQPVWVALILVLAWPAGAGEWLLRLLVASALLLVVLALDTPWSMAAWLWDVQLKTHEPGRASPLLWWNTFLNGGGRLALGLIAGVVAIAAAERGAQHWRVKR